MFIQASGHAGDMELREGLDAECFDEFAHALGQTASVVCVTGDDVHRSLGLVASFEVLVVEVSAVPQFWISTS